mmetsp:Transcript_20090/g.63493  ORF Transcript_20090/g.63493 Transcript_20090/m.63493 type:complete len:230 (-) Transcript_20090:434-1123(-)
MGGVHRAAGDAPRADEAQGVAIVVEPEQCPLAPVCLRSPDNISRQRGAASAHSEAHARARLLELEGGEELDNHGRHAAGDEAREHVRDDELAQGHGGTGCSPQERERRSNVAHADGDAKGWEVARAVRQRQGYYGQGGDGLAEEFHGFARAQGDEHVQRAQAQVRHAHAIVLERRLRLRWEDSEARRHHGEGGGRVSEGHGREARGHGLVALALRGGGHHGPVGWRVER